MCFSISQSLSLIKLLQSNYIKLSFRSIYCDCGFWETTAVKIPYSLLESFIYMNYCYFQTNEHCLSRWSQSCFPGTELQATQSMRRHQGHSFNGAEGSYGVQGTGDHWKHVTTWFFKLFEPAKSTKFIRAFVDSDRSPPPDKRCTWWERPPVKVQCKQSFPCGFICWEWRLVNLSPLT